MMNTGAMLLTPCWMRCGRAFLDGNGGRYAPKSSAMSAINVRTPQCVFLVFMFGISNAVPQCLTTKLRHSRPLASDLPTEAFNGCCLERLLSHVVINQWRGNSLGRLLTSRIHEPSRG